MPADCKHVVITAAGVQQLLRWHELNCALAIPACCVALWKRVVSAATVSSLWNMQDTSRGAHVHGVLQLLILAIEVGSSSDSCFGYSSTAKSQKASMLMHKCYVSPCIICFYNVSPRKACIARLLMADGGKQIRGFIP
jgi:hypothetical protein